MNATRTPDRHWRRAPSGRATAARQGAADGWRTTTGRQCFAIRRRLDVATSVGERYLAMAAQHAAAGDAERAQAARTAAQRWLDEADHHRAEIAALGC